MDFANLAECCAQHRFECGRFKDDRNAEGGNDDACDSAEAASAARSRGSNTTSAPTSSSSRCCKAAPTGSLHGMLRVAGLANAHQLQSLACAALQALAPLASPGFAAGGVTAACCPYPMDVMADIGASCFGKDTAPEVSLQRLEQGLLVATLFQGSLGIIRICLGDVFTGSYQLLLAAVGFNSRHPGPASGLLKTYVLITFINGTMGSIDLAQNMLLQNLPVILATLPLKVNLIHLVQLLGPGVAFAGAYSGWQHIQAQREVALQRYQEHLVMLMQQTPWPPPLLPGLPPLPPGYQQLQQDSNDDGQLS